jgi:4-amino-4-deoxy-L-arabinose transferase
VLLPLVVFFLARSRLPLYVLPLLAPLTLLLARELDARVDLSRRGPRVRLALWVLLLLALKGGLALGVHTRNDERALAVRLATAAVARPYAALMFVEDVGTAYQREQRTPWGLNLYLRRPVYAVAWRSAGDRARLCGTLDARGALLVVADRGIATAVQSALRGCAARVEPLGTLYQARLLWATPAGGH